MTRSNRMRPGSIRAALAIAGKRQLAIRRDHQALHRSMMAAQGNAICVRLYRRWQRSSAAGRPHIVWPGGLIVIEAIVQLTLLQIGFVQIRSAQVRAGQLSPPQVGTREVGIRQYRFA